MRKQGDIAASIPNQPASSPGSRLGACMRKTIPRLEPGPIKAPMRKQGDIAASIYGRRKTSSETGMRPVRPTSSSVRRWPTECQGVTSASSGMISRI